MAGYGSLKIGYSQVCNICTGYEAQLNFHTQFNRNGLPCVNHEPGYRPIVMLPPEHIGWISERTDHELSSRKTQACLSISFPCQA